MMPKNDEVIDRLQSLVLQLEQSPTSHQPSTHAPIEMDAIHPKTIHLHSIRPRDFDRKSLLRRHNKYLVVDEYLEWFDEWTL